MYIPIKVYWKLLLQIDKTVQLSQKTKKIKVTSFCLQMLLIHLNSLFETHSSKILTYSTTRKIKIQKQFISNSLKGPFQNH